MVMKKIVYLIWLLLFSLSFWVKAEYAIYDNIGDFETAKWEVCETATDGCNTFFMIDWKVAGWTLMYCANHKPEWTCKKFKDNVITTKSLIDTEKPVACTMEYAPVCWIDWKTYSNSCMAEKWSKVDIDYTWACNIKLSTNDLIFYNSIKNQKLDKKYQSSVYKAFDKYKEIISKYSKEKQKLYNKRMIKKIDKKISEMLMEYPQDIALPKKVNIKYLSFKLLKFEIKML